MAIGIICALIGDGPLPRLGIHLEVGTVRLIVDATVGTIVLLLIIRLVAKRARDMALQCMALARSPKQTA